MNKIKNRRYELSHVSFSLTFTFLLFVICNAFIIDKIALWFTQDDGTDYVGLLAFMVFGLCIFLMIFVLFAHRWIIKPMAIFFIVASTAVTYFISKYNIAIESTMLMNVVHTDLTEISGLLSIYMIPYILFLILLPVYAVLRIRIRFNGRFRYLLASLGVFILAVVVGIGSVYLKYNSIHRAVNISNRYVLNALVPLNYIKSLGSIAQKAVESYQNEQYSKRPINAELIKTEDIAVVLAIGESSRLKNFSLYGYQRKNTNPVLSTIDGLHLLKGKSKIGTTLLALNQILQRDHFKLPGITHTAGVNTSCYANFKLYGNCDAVGEINVDNCAHDGKCYDEDVIPLLEQNLANYQSGQRLIVLHLGGGSHGPLYYKRHPPEFQVFQPQCQEADILGHCTREELYNAYDNTLLYVDFVLSEIIKSLEHSRVPYVLIYMSDHGESLLENGLIFHGMPPGIPLPPEQAEVPLIVKSSVPISVQKRDEYTQQDVFDTVLDLLSIKTDILQKDRVFIKLSTAAKTSG